MMSAPKYNERNFAATYAALTDPNGAGLAPVSRFADIHIGEFIADIVWAQMQVGIPDEAAVEKILAASTKESDPSKPFIFNGAFLYDAGLISKDSDDYDQNDAIDALYKCVEFQPGTRPMKVIEVCYEPKTPETMQHYLQAACRHRDEHEEDGLVVLIGTVQSAFRYRTMVENLDLRDASPEQVREVLKTYRPTVEQIDPTAEANLQREREIYDKELFRYANETGCTPDGMASTSLTPLRDPYILEQCLKNGILLAPNVGSDPTQVLECLESIVVKNGEIAGGAAIQKVFPFGGLVAKGWVPGIMATHPNAKLMTTGGANMYKARELIMYGVVCIGASAPAKKAAIVSAIYKQYKQGLPREVAWADYIRDASMFATEIHIGRIIKARAEAKAAAKDEKLNAMFAEALDIKKGS